MPIPENKKSHIVVINDFIEYLNNSVEYVILRNYEKLPIEYGNDIDILISKNQALECIQQLEKITKKYGFKIDRIIKKYCYFGVYINIDNNILLIDLFTDIVKGWVQYADRDLILSTRRQYNNFFIPLIEYEIGIIVFKEILTYSKVRQKYSQRMESASSDLDRHIFFSMFDNYFSKKNTDVVLKKIQNNEIFSSELKVKPRLARFLRPFEFLKWLIKKIKKD